MPFGRDTRLGVSPINTVLDGVQTAQNKNKIAGKNPKSKFSMQIAAKPLLIV